MGNIQNTFAVNPQAFVDSEYPIDATTPTKQLPVPVYTDIIVNYIVIWAIIIWPCMIVLSLVGIFTNYKKMQIEEHGGEK